MLLDKASAGERAPKTAEAASGRSGVSDLAFVVPLLWFHREMANAKLELQHEADLISTEILAPRSSASEHSEASAIPPATVQWARQRYDAIEQMPTWPVDVKTRRRFSVNNLILFLPLLGQAVGQSGLATRISEILGGIA